MNDESRQPESRGALFAVVALVLGTWVWIAVTVPWTGTESRRAVIARAMLDSGDWVVPMHGGEVSLTKPPLHYDLQAIAMAVFGRNELASRLPSMMLALALACCFVLAGRRIGRGGSYALAGAFVLIVHPLVAMFATSAEIDGAFSAWVGMALLGLAAATVEPTRWSWLLASAVMAGGAGLTKGYPVAAMFLGPAWLRAYRSLGWRRLVVWLLVSALPTLGWLGLLEARGALVELQRVATSETVGRFAFLEWRRIARIPLDLAKFVTLLLPVLLLALHSEPGGRRLEGRRDRALSVVAWGGIGGVLLFMAMPHRATRYLLPGVPPLVFCLVHGCGAWLESGPTRYREFRRLLAVLALAALPVALIALPPFMTMAPAALCLAFVGLSLRGWLPLFAGVGLAVYLFVAHDLALRRSLPPRDLEATARIVAARTRGDAVTTWSYLPSELAWELGDRVRFDEYMRRETIDTPWVVFTDAPGDRPPPANVDVELRISMRKGTLYLARVRKR